MKPPGAALVAAIVAQACLVGCGREGAGTCGRVPACGGDPVGVWDVASVCFNEYFFPSLCEVSVLNQALTVSGTLSFEPNRSYTKEITRTWEWSLLVPTGCLHPARFEEPGRRTAP